MKSHTTMRKRGAGLIFILFFLILLNLCPVQASPFYAKLAAKSYLTGEHAAITLKKKKKVDYQLSSSDEAVVTADQQGNLSFHQAGEAVITVTGSWVERSTVKMKKKDGSVQRIHVRTTKEKTKEIPVRVYQPALSSSDLSVYRTETVSLSVLGNALNRPVSFSSRDPQIAFVDDQGQITGVSEGSTEITVQVGTANTLTGRVSVLLERLNTKSAKLLSNKSGTYSVLDLAGLSELPSRTDAAISYQAENSQYGSLNGSVYHALLPGKNTVTVSAGRFEEKIAVRTYRWDAHRGYLDRYPENTVEAFLGAVQYGAFAIETDVRFTSDGVPVCFHDKSVAVMTNGSGNIGKKTLEEVEALKIDNGNGIDDCRDPRIPLLEEYLKICKENQIIAALDIKSLGFDREAGAKKIYEMLALFGMLDQCVIMSGRPVLMQVFQAVNGSRIPVCCYSETAYPEMQGLGIENLYYGMGALLEGATAADYCPVLGRLGLVRSVYRSGIEDEGE